MPHPVSLPPRLVWVRALHAPAMRDCVPDELVAVSPYSLPGLIKRWHISVCWDAEEGVSEARLTVSENGVMVEGAAAFTRSESDAMYMAQKLEDGIASEAAAKGIRHPA